MAERATDELETARQLLPAGGRVDLQISCGLSAADGLHRMAAELDAALIVVGISREHGLGRIVAGSVTELTLHGAPCAVAVAAPAEEGTREYAFRRIVAADDGSAESAAAHVLAAQIARASGAHLDLVGVSDEIAVWYGAYMGPTTPDELRDETLTRLQAVRDELEAGGDPPAGGIAVHSLRGNAVTTLRTFCSDADLLVMGSRDHGPVSRTLLGSVSSRLVRHAPCPLIVVPRTAMARAAAVSTQADVTPAAPS